MISNAADAFINFAQGITKVLESVKIEEPIDEDVAEGKEIVGLEIVGTKLKIVEEMPSHGAAQTFATGTFTVVRVVGSVMR